MTCADHGPPPSRASTRANRREDWSVRVLLIHSPLVGPASLHPLAAALEELGWTTRLPDLRAGVSPSPSRFASLAAGEPGADVVVGHSGAGAFLPTVATAVGASATLFVDAILPPAADQYEPPAAMLALLDSLPLAAGALPAWHTWWPPQVMEGLVPDDAQRRGPRRRDPARLASLLRRRRAATGALVDQAGRLRPAQHQLRRRAGAGRTWGWPTSRLDGTHLDTATRPGVVAEQIRELTSRIRRSG